MISYHICKKFRRASVFAPSALNAVTERLGVRKVDYNKYDSRRQASSIVIWPRFGEYCSNEKRAIRKFVCFLREGVRGDIFQLITFSAVRRGGDGKIVGYDLPCKILASFELMSTRDARLPRLTKDEKRFWCKEIREQMDNENDRT